MNAAHIKLHYQSLVSLLKQYKQAPLTQSSTTQTLALCDALLDDLKIHPDQLTAQLSLTKTSLPYTVNLVFNCTLVTAILALRNSFNSTCTQQIMGSVVSLLGCHQHAIEQKKNLVFSADGGKTVSRLAHSMGRHGLEVWQHNLSLAEAFMAMCHLTDTQAAKFNPSARIAALGLCIGYYITDSGERHCHSLAVTLRRLCQQLELEWHALVAPLLVYPGLMPPGSIIKRRDNYTAMVLSVCEDKLITRLVGENEGSISLCTFDEVVKTSAARPLTRFAKMDTWWDQAWHENSTRQAKALSVAPSLYRLDRPPPSLVQLQNHLANDDIDFDQLAQLIAREPALANYLKDSASQASRENLPIARVKHGLLMHGYVKSNSLLIQQALLLRLNQHYFPLQQQFVQFTRLRAHVAQAIMELANPRHHEEAGTLACFACGGLFSVVPLKGKLRWTRRSERLFALQSLIDDKVADIASEHSVRLAQAWHQGAPQVMALHHQDVLPAQLPEQKLAARYAITLGLSLILSRQIFFGDEGVCDATAQYIEEGCALLDLQSTCLEEIKSKASEFSHVYSPFPP